MSDIENLKGLSTGLNVIAGRPAMGTSTFALNIATNVALKGNTPVAIFSLEMSKEQVVSIIIGSEATKKLSDTKIYIDDTPGISITEIEEKCRKLRIEKNIGLIVIDYIQLIQGSSNKIDGSREQELSEISRSLKILAKEIKVPVIVLSQLSKEPENRHNKGQDPRPTLKDFRCSGALVQDADVIMFLYRDEYYYPNSEEKNVAEIIIAKNRYGSCGTVKLKKLLQCSKFKELEHKKMN